MAERAGRGKPQLRHVSRECQELSPGGLSWARCAVKVGVFREHGVDMSDYPNLKDQLVNPEKVARLAGWVEAAMPDFKRADFVVEVSAQLPELELKARLFSIAEALGRHLPQDFSSAAQIIHDALPPELDPSLKDDDFGEFIFDGFGQFVAAYGIEHPKTALPLLHALTRRFSMEFALRPFLIRHKSFVLDQLHSWARDDNYHVRRLVSEGTRPNLPWGQKIGWDVTDAMPLLDQLYGDPTRFVTRSVANHLNDIAKTHPDLVVDTLARWQGEDRQSEKELAWITRHACRTLIKQGHQGALEFLGYRPDAKVTLGAIDLQPSDRRVAINTALTVSFDVTAECDEPVIVDYVIRFQRAHGKAADKVFKLKQAHLKAGQSVALSKRHLFKGNATTFRLYPGPHVLIVQINGRQVAEAPFELYDAEGSNGSSG